MKQLDFSKSIYELAGQFPEVINIMKELGFLEITNPISLKTMGRFMTIPKGSALKNIPLEEIIDKFEAHGFQVINSGL